MNSKQLHSKFYSKYDLTKWFNESNELSKEQDVKYYHCGTKNDFNRSLVDNAIQTYYSDDNVYLIISTGNSSLFPKSEIVNEIEKFIGKKEIGLMDKDLKKLMFFSHIGVFKKGVVINYPKSRIRKNSSLLKVGFHANMMDSKTKHVTDIIDKPFEVLSEKLSNDYGGNMEHLWIDLELIERHLADRMPHSFRFQKRVTLSGFGLPGKEYKYNVGHYSVAPDFEKLKSLPEELICDYILRLVYESTQVLVDKKKKLDDFKSEQFRKDFIAVCEELGYSIKEK